MEDTFGKNHVDKEIHQINDDIKKQHNTTCRSRLDSLKMDQSSAANRTMGTYKPTRT